MISTPRGVTSVEERAVHDAAMQAGAGAAYLIPEPLAAAYGAGLPIGTPTGNLVLDMGGGTTECAVVSMYGSVVSNAAQNQIVVINRGTADGIESGHVLAILKDGQSLVDRDGDKRTAIKLPDERNGLLMVFRPFEKLSYALILEITDGVKVGDRVVNPR